MSAPPGESESPRSGHKRFGIALIVCFVGFCLVMCYLLLSAPLLLYAVHHPGSSSAGLVDCYMQPLLWYEELESASLPVYETPLFTKVLYQYYGLWGWRVQNKYTQLRFERWVESVTESMEEQAPFPGAEGPDSGT